MDYSSDTDSPMEKYIASTDKPLPSFAEESSFAQVFAGIAPIDAKMEEEAFCFGGEIATDLKQIIGGDGFSTVRFDQQKPLFAEKPLLVQIEEERPQEFFEDDKSEEAMPAELP